VTVAAARQRGLALIVVLWASALMTLLGASFAFSLRTEARLATTVVERAGAAAAARAGLARLQALLVVQPRGPRTAISGSMSFDGFQVNLLATPENGRVDLNAAPPALLLGLMQQAIAATGSEASAEALTDAVLDWRDADENARNQGAEARDYEAAGLPDRPRNGAFLSVTELIRVKGMEASLYRVLEPVVTVHAWSPQVDAMSASRLVLQALPGVDQAQVDAFLEARTEGPAALALLAGAGRYVARSGGSVFSLAASARSEAGVVVSRRSVVKLSANAARPATVLAWFAGVAPVQGAPVTDAETTDTTTSRTN
jgi:general secretion pathway protein K